MKLANLRKAAVFNGTANPSQTVLVTGRAGQYDGIIVIP